jgi:hypothetical protein
MTLSIVVHIIKVAGEHCEVHGLHPAHEKKTAAHIYFVDATMRKLLLLHVLTKNSSQVKK